MMVNQLGGLSKPNAATRTQDSLQLMAIQESNLEHEDKMGGKDDEVSNFTEQPSGLLSPLRHQRLAKLEDAQRKVSFASAAEKQGRNQLSKSSMSRDATPPKSNSSYSRSGTQ